jgi:hypothetical protein
MDIEERNWLQALIGLPFIGAWIGFFVLLVPFFLAMLAIWVVATFAGHSLRISFDQNTGSGAALLATGLVLGAWLMALQAFMKVRLVMPIIPVPWIWLMALFVVSGCLQLAGGSGTISLGR